MKSKLVVLLMVVCPMLIAPISHNSVIRLFG